MNECSKVELICYGKIASNFCYSVSQILLKIRSRPGNEFSKILQMIGSGRGNACCNFQGWHLNLLQRLLSASKARHFSLSFNLRLFLSLASSKSCFVGYLT
ncbi:hypothetical protein V6N12_051323 [Hibiscus sabdariffa]|uniref:Uncharacterized protein n=1 Tax=Hibiscus sabdariffa TaxID=183260 RepID=A0ABR2GF02_9ROSI